jgi:co-chaperonin GroES (HSP10)
MSSAIDLVKKPNCYTIIETGKAPFILEALGDRLIIQEDKFKTGYECKACEGEGYIPDIACSFCVGRGLPAGFEDVNGTACRLCYGLERGTQGLHHGKGCKTCDICNGRGASIVIPQESVRRPTSGVIMSVGPDVNNHNLSIGTRVIYAIFAGTAIEFKGSGTCRILHENEIMGIVYGTANLGDIVK